MAKRVKSCIVFICIVSPTVFCSKNVKCFSDFFSACKKAQGQSFQSFSRIICHRLCLSCNRNLETSLLWIYILRFMPLSSIYIIAHISKLAEAIQTKLGEHVGDNNVVKNRNVICTSCRAEISFVQTLSCVKCG